MGSPLAKRMALDIAPSGDDVGLLSTMPRLVLHKVMDYLSFDDLRRLRTVSESMKTVPFMSLESLDFGTIDQDSY